MKRCSHTLYILGTCSVHSYYNYIHDTVCIIYIIYIEVVVNCNNYCSHLWGGLTSYSLLNVFCGKLKAIFSLFANSVYRYVDRLAYRTLLFWAVLWINGPTNRWTTWKLTGICVWINIWSTVSPRPSKFPTCHTQIETQGSTLSGQSMCNSYSKLFRDDLKELRRGSCIKDLTMPTLVNHAQRLPW